MYKIQSKQIGINDFGMPLGMKLSPENRWVKKAEMIPWDEIELKYASLFKSRKGNVAKPLRLALGALIIQAEREISDVETPLQIQETPCLQYFCGMPSYEDKLPFDSSLMVYFRKRLTPEILGEINELIIKKAKSGDEPPPPDDTGTDPPDDSEESEGSEDKGDEPKNKGTLLVDATCAPQNIRYPQDTSLLNEARENLEKMIDLVHAPADGEKPRTYRKKARREYLKFSKKRKKTRKEIRKARKALLQYIRRNLLTTDTMLQSGKKLPKWHMERLAVIRILYEQQLEMHTKGTCKTDNRIVSLGQPWIRPIVRGKASAKCEFGSKVEISVSEGFTRLERTSFDAYNESTSLIGIIDKYRQREGHYPERVLIDGIYRTRENLMYCKKHRIQISGKPLGRPRKDVPVDKKKMRADEIDRIEVERKLSHAKGSYGLGLIRNRLKETSETAIALSIIALNLSHIGRILCTYFEVLLWILARNGFMRKQAIVQ
jgi:hypothetical protein